MFIRKTKINSNCDGEVDYFTYRIVASERIGDKVKQRTLLNLGKHFDIEPAHWPLLITRIQHLLSGQRDFFEDDLKLDPTLETAAHRYAAAILQKHAYPCENSDHKNNFESINLNEIEVMQPRSIGVETIAYHALEQLDLMPKLKALGFNSKEMAAAVGNIVGRLVAPDSELATIEWLQSRSALGELIGHDFHTTSLTRLYRVTDQLLDNREEIEKHLYQRETDLFNLDCRIVLYDLTNTYCEGKASENPKTQFGRSKEKRSDCRSEGKERKEQSIRDTFSDRFEQELQNLNGGLNKKGCTKRYEKVLERVGRLREKNFRVSKEYRIEVIADEKKQHAVEIKWQHQGTHKDEQMGVYCLRTNLLDWEADTLWRTYVMLTEVESTFRSLKTDFGLRPIYHRKESRVSAHLFISFLAYHVAHTIRFQLKNKGIHLSWKRLRNIMSSQQRVTVSLLTENNEVIHVRTTTRAEVGQKAIGDALGIRTDKIGKRMVVMDTK